MRKCAREPVLVADERCIACRIALARAGDDRFRRKRFATVRAMVSHEARTRNPGFDASMLAAEARRAGTLVVVWPRQRVMPPFAADRVATLEHAAVHDDPATDAGTENDAKDDAGAASRAIGRFGQCEAVGVVGERDRAAKAGLEIALHRHPVQAHRIGAAQQAGRARKRSRRADADARLAGRDATFLLGIGDELRHDLQDRVVVVARRRHAAAHSLATVVVQCDDLRFRSAEIDADAQRRRRGARRRVDARENLGFAGLPLGHFAARLEVRQRAANLVGRDGCHRTDRPSGDALDGVRRGRMGGQVTPDRIQQRFVPVRVVARFVRHQESQVDVAIAIRNITGSRVPRVRGMADRRGIGRGRNR